MLCCIFEDILQGDLEGRAEQLVQYGREDPAWVRDLMLSLSKLLERTRLAPEHPKYLNPVSFGGYFKPVKKLLEMNDVAIPWRRIYATFPEETGPSSSSNRHLEDCVAILVPLGAFFIVFFFLSWPAFLLRL